MPERPAPPSPPRAADACDRERLRGPQLVQCLHAALRGLRLYSSGNQALREQIRQLLTCIDGVMDEQAILVGMGENFFVNGVRLPHDPVAVPLRRSLVAEFEPRGLAGLRFAPGLSADELETFLRCLLRVRDATEAARLAEEATRAGVLHAAPVRVEEMAAWSMGAGEAGGEGARAEPESEADAYEEERRRAGRDFRNALQGTRGLILRAAQTGRPALQLARRLVQPIVDSVLRNEFSIVGLTALKDHDEYTYAHCVNVSVLAISMGQKLELPRQTLANLGVAALLHDVGKLMVPAEVLRKPGRLVPGELELVRRHPLHGVRMISRLRGLMPLTLDCMHVAFQHHMNADLSGYPRVKGGGEPAAFSRVVAVADLFDALTSHRAYRARPFTGFEALREVLHRRRRHLDPGAAWALVKTVGLYPAGTMMLTESDHLLMSLSPNPSNPARPYCRVVMRPDSTVPEPKSPEIWAPMPADQRVARVVDPEELVVDRDALLAA